MKYLLFILALLLVNSQCLNVNSKIKNIIVICMENHSYDNLLGFMKSPIGDLTGAEYQLLNPSDPTSQKYFVKRGANYQTKPDPPHSFSAVNQQLYGTPKFPIDNSILPNNTGFAQQFKQSGGDPQTIMNIYTPAQLPVISSLAQNFTTFNRWFCSIPSSTAPNRWFLYSASSNGRTNNPSKNPLQWPKGVYPLKMPSIFDSLQKDGVTWSSHFMDWNDALFVYPTNTHLKHFVLDPKFKKFYEKLETGTLESFTYLVPRAFNSFGNQANDQHPSQDIRNGEQLLKEIYENLRNSPIWNQSLLLITYDEHGGFWDSVPPSRTLKNPIPGNTGSPNIFMFDRSGPRVPAIAISPWLPAQVDSTVLEHSSIPATIKQFFNLSSPYLNPRDEDANIFFSESTLLDSPRTDCPEKLPDVFPSFEEVPQLEKLEADNMDSVINAVGMMLVQHYNLIDEDEYLKIRDLLVNDDLKSQFLLEVYQYMGVTIDQPLQTDFLTPFTSRSSMSL